MGKIFDEISTEMRELISAQKLFFVSTAPLDATGHINCSPKGGDAFRVLGLHEVAYADQTGWWHRNRGPSQGKRPDCDYVLRL